MTNQKIADYFGQCDLETFKETLHSKHLSYKLEIEEEPADCDSETFKKALHPKHLSYKLHQGKESRLKLPIGKSSYLTSTNRQFIQMIDVKLKVL